MTRARRSKEKNNVCLTIESDAGETTHRVRPGLTVAQALGACAVAFPLDCAGSGICGKCRVRAWGALSPLTAHEIARLTESDIDAGIRLACQARLLGSAHVKLAHMGGARILTEGTGVAAEDASPSMPRLDASERCGAALDIGTTTLAMSIWRLDRPERRLAAEGVLNPQRILGADVISRVGAALEGHSGVLRDLLLHEILRMLDRLCAQAGIQPEALDSMVVTGNTTMLYLLTGTDPEPLSHAPFAITEQFGRELPGCMLGPRLSRCRLYLPLCASAFVGADIMCAALACNLTADHPRMLCDLGTNGEIALYDGERLLCASTAAGPALEGATISIGMHARDGAIDTVRAVGGALVCGMIGDGAAIGICGSGIVDAVAAARKLNLLDESGALCSALCRNGIPLRDGLFLTQKDIRQVQLCKAAIRAGIETLLERADLGAEQIRALYLAGGLGIGIYPQSAADIGLFPTAMLSITKSVGNAALRGAERILTQPEQAKELTRIAEAARAFDLSTDPSFPERYLNHMALEDPAVET